MPVFESKPCLHVGYSLPQPVFTPVASICVSNAQGQAVSAYAHGVAHDDTAARPVVRRQGSRVGLPLIAKQMLFNVLCTTETHHAALCSMLHVRAHTTVAAIAAKITGMPPSTVSLYLKEFIINGFPTAEPTPSTSRSTNMCSPPDRSASMPHDHLPSPIFDCTVSVDDVMDAPSACHARDSHAPAPVPSPPSITAASTLARWRTHPSWPIGLRMAELSTCGSAMHYHAICFADLWLGLIPITAAFSAS